MNWDGAVVGDEKRLTLKQERRLLRMVEVLRDPLSLSQILDLKIAVSKKDYEYAQGLFQEFTQEEQEALYVAPSYGGILTTFERQIAKYGRENP